MVISFSDSGTNFTNISFPPGVSSDSDLDTYIKEKTIIKNLAKTMSTSSLLQLDDSIFKVTITLKTNYQLDLTKSSFYKLIGFDKKVLKTAAKNVGTKVPNLS